MSRRIEVQLTSAKPEGVWTWRAAGAKEPKGNVSSDLLYEGAKVGDVVRAEADFDIDGIRILQVFPPSAPRAATGAQTLEVKGSERHVEGVTSSLVGKRGKPSRPGRPPSHRGAAEERNGASRRSPRGEGEPPAETGRNARDERPGSRSPQGRRGGPERSRPEQVATAAREPARPHAPKKLAVRSTHRAAALSALPQEQRPIAEQVLKGGIPAVRQALEAQNAEARTSGSPEIPVQPVLELAEQLLPRLKAAAWRDRAEAVAASTNQVSLRDLRSVVAGADAARDEESRELGATLRAALEKRVNEGRERWLGDITRMLEEGRVVRALRLSSRPPDPSARFPAELALSLSRAASEAMTPDTLPDRWLAVLEAVSESPVRRSVHPTGLAAQPDQQLLSAARRLSGKVPAMAPLLGIDMPPPPGPPRATPGPRPIPPRPQRKPIRPTRAPDAESAEPGPEPVGTGAAAGTAAAQSAPDRIAPGSAEPAEDPVASQERAEAVDEG